MSIQSEITRLQGAKGDLKTAINSVTDEEHKITNETIDEYSDYFQYISTSADSNIYKFATLQEAQAKNDYNVGDIAVVMNKKSVPFYPVIWRNTSLGLGNWINIQVVDTVTFDTTPTAVNYSKTWTTGTGTKSYSHTLSIVVNSTTVSIRLPYSNNSSEELSLSWASQDGLTYTFDYGQTIAITPTNTPRVKTYFVGSTTNPMLATIMQYFLSDWTTCEIISKFLVYSMNDIINNYYRYEGIYTDGGTLSPIYPRNYSTTVIGDNNTIIDVLPYDTTYVVDANWFRQYTPFGSSETSSPILDFGNILYVRAYVVYNTANNKWLVCSVNADTAYSINKSTGAYTQLTASDTLTIILATNTTQTLYILDDDLDITSLKAAINCAGTYDNGINTISSFKEYLPITLELNKNNQLAKTSDNIGIHTSNYGTPLNRAESLGLVLYNKVDTDMCLALANSILGVN